MHLENVCKKIKMKKKKKIKKNEKMKKKDFSEIHIMPSHT